MFQLFQALFCCRSENAHLNGIEHIFNALLHLGKILPQKRKRFTLFSQGFHHLLSQAYADVNSAIGAFDPANRPTLTQDDAATGYTSSASNVLLGALAASRLEALDAEDGSWVKVNGPFIGEVYKKIGIDVITNGTNDKSFADIMKTCFEDVAGTGIYNEYGHDYSLREMPAEGAEKNYDMLMYYGGACFASNKQRKLTDISDLWPGDVIMMGRRQSSFYVTAIYQGNNKFLLNVQNRSSLTIDQKIWKNLYFASNNEFIAWLNSSVTDMAETLDSKNTFDPTTAEQLLFENYVVLRPSRAFEDINTIVSGLRDITESALTDTEKNILSQIQPSDYDSATVGGANLDKVLPWLYKMAGINIEVGAYEAKTVNSLVGLIFDTSVNPYGQTSSDTSDLAKYYQTIRLENCWGGVIDGAADRKIADVVSQLQIGDVVCGRYKGTKNYYYTALYQGDHFLVVYDVFNPENDGRTEGKGIMSAAELNAMEFTYRYILRPEQLADADVVDPPSEPSEPSEPTEPSYRDITTGVLTDEEKAAFGAITAEQWAANSSAGNVDKILIWAYNAIGVDITKAEGYTAKTVHNIFNYLFELPSGATYYALRAEDPADAASVFYHNIQMPGIYGGTIFESNVSLAENVDSLHVGDVFCARLRTVVDGKNQDRYWIGLYQGDGKFLTVHTTLEKEVLCDVISAAELDATAFQYYYVLRPEKLAVDYTESNPPTGDAIGLVAAMLVLSGMAVIALKKKED